MEHIPGELLAGGSDGDDSSDSLDDSLLLTALAGCEGPGRRGFTRRPEAAASRRARAARAGGLRPDSNNPGPAGSGRWQPEGGSPSCEPGYGFRVTPGGGSGWGCNQVGEGRLRSSFLQAPELGAKAGHPMRPPEVGKTPSRRRSRL